MKKRQLPRSAPRGRRTTVSPKAVLGTAAALLAVFLLLASVIGLAEKHIAIRKRINDLRTEQGALEKKEDHLTETNAYLATPEGAEQTLRAKFNVVRPGEEMIIITPHAEAAAPAGPDSRIGRWWDTILKGLGIRK